MALQIASPVVVSKIERLARIMGLSKIAAVERAMDRLISETEGNGESPGNAHGRMIALLSQLDPIPDRSDAFDPLEWDEHGLPR